MEMNPRNYLSAESCHSMAGYTHGFGLYYLRRQKSKSTALPLSLWESKGRSPSSEMNLCHSLEIFNDPFSYKILATYLAAWLLHVLRVTHPTIFLFKALHGPSQLLFYSSLFYGKASKCVKKILSF